MLEVDLHHEVGRFRLEASFSVGDGVTVVFGPSGAGKSMTLRLIGGIDRPTGGLIRLASQTMVDTDQGVWVPPRLRRVGMVFQDSLLLPHRTVLDNVALAVRAGSRRVRRQVASRWLEAAQATEWADSRPHQLSGGQAQRVAVARALAGDPHLLLLDEPFNSLESVVRRHLGGLVRDLVTERAIPTLFVTHDHEEASELADRVVTARDGQVRLAPTFDRTTPPTWDP